MSQRTICDLCGEEVDGDTVVKAEATTFGPGTQPGDLPDVPQVVSMEVDHLDFHPDCWPKAKGKLKGTTAARK